MNKLNNKIKPSYNENRSVLGEVLPLDTPFSIIIDTSEICNFKCNYCFRSSEEKKNWGYANDELMEWKTFEKVVEQIKMFPGKVKQISLSNHGEPLCNKNIPNMVMYIKNQGITSTISIHTNASLLNYEYVKQLAESNIDKVVVSLQGLSKDNYKKTCGFKLNYEEFFNNLKLFYEMKQNTLLCVKIADIALVEGEEEEFFQKYSSIADRIFIEKIEPIWSNVKIEALSKEKHNKYGEVFEEQKCCPLLFYTLVVTPIGDVYPCTQLLSREKLGNIETKTLVEMWNSDYRKEILKRQLNLESAKWCKECYIKQNSIFTKKDMIDAYREDILKRL